MTVEEMKTLMEAMNALRPQQTLNFNAPIGQQIAHVDKIEAHFDKDMSMEVMGSEAPKAESPTAVKEVKMPLTNEAIKVCIDSVMIDITQQNHWFAIVKPLVWVGVLTDGDYDGAVKFVHSLYPRGLKVNFTKDDIRKMDVDSLRKSLSLWNENDSPIHGARFSRMKKLATSFFALLSQYDTTQKLS